MNANQKTTNGKGIKCTLADSELEECYHTRPDSLKTTLIVKYCLGDFEGCEIYRAVKKKETDE